MKMVETSPSVAQSGHVLGRPWRNLKALLVVSALIGLLSLNVLTLLNDTIHAAGYGMLRAILASALTEAALSRVLRDSPTARMNQGITTATKMLSEENADLAEANRVLSEKNADLSKKNADLDKANGALSKRNTDLFASNRELLIKNVSLSALNRGIEKKRVEVDRTNKRIAAEHAALKRSSDRQALTAKKISTRLAARYVANASRNMSSVAGQAIPFAGTAIILGVTAWDVYDACETMKDINELNNAHGHVKIDHTRVCGMRISIPNQQQVLAQIRSNWKTAYQSAADSVNGAGTVLVPSTPMELSWRDVRGTVCPVVGAVPGVCP